MERTYSIKDLEQISGIKAHTIRIWEQRYGIINPKRTKTNLRRYTEEQLKKLLNISILNRQGLKISKLAEMCTTDLNAQVLNLVDGIGNVDDRIEMLIFALLKADQVAFTNIVGKITDESGLEFLFLNVLFPFFDRVGLLWQVGSIGPSQEHFVVNICRQKLIAGTENLPLRKKNGKSFLLFLPEGEWHEMGLLFSQYMLKKRGFEVYYLGQSVPFNSLIDFCNIRKVDCILATFTSAWDENKLEIYLDQLTTRLSGMTIFVSGKQILESNVGKGKDFIVLSDFESFKNEIDLLVDQ